MACERCGVMLWVVRSGSRLATLVDVPDQHVQLCSERFSSFLSHAFDRRFDLVDPFLISIVCLQVRRPSDPATPPPVESDPMNVSLAALQTR